MNSMVSRFLDERFPSSAIAQNVWFFLWLLGTILNVFLYIIDGINTLYRLMNSSVSWHAIVAPAIPNSKSTSPHLYL